MARTREAETKKTSIIDHRKRKRGQTRPDQTRPQRDKIERRPETRYELHLQKQFSNGMAFYILEAERER